MTNQYQYGYADVGLCYRCSNPAHLWVHSYIDNCPNYCMNCLVRVLTHFQRSIEGSESVGLSYSLENLPTLNPTILRELQSVPLCKACNEPEVTTEHHTRFVEGLWNDLETAQVHMRCTWKCEDCDKRYLSNDRSDSEHSLAYAETLDGRDKCPTCVEEYITDHGGESNFLTCDNCDQRYLRDDMRIWNGRDTCSYCYDNNVNECDDCGNYYWYGRNHDCEYDDSDESEVIHNHGYRPSFEFFGSGNYHLGFELEVESRNSSRHEGAQFVQDVLGGHAYIKEDGSLDDGFEIVTHPHTLSEYQSNFDWNVLASLKRKGYRSWNTDTCGIHVHVSRTAFDSGGINDRSRRIILRQAHELRFMKLIYDNQRQVERIAGRTDCHYASFLDKGGLVRKVKYGNQENGRYSAVNTENHATLEVRVFKGSLRKERVLSAIEFVTASVEYTRGLSVTGKNRALTWLHFTAYVSTHVETYPNLALIMAESFNNDTPIDGITNDN